MEYVRFDDLTDAQWEQAHKAFYSLELTREQGGTLPDVVPSLQEFYNTTWDAIDSGDLVGWAIVDDERYLGHALLVHPHGEWEVGVAVADKQNRGTGMGLRAALYALRYAFEELEAEHVVAFTNNPNSDIRDILLRGGFKPLFHFLYITKDTWEERWARRKD